MSLLLGTLLALTFLALALGLRLILGGDDLQAGCSGRGSIRQCATCPRRKLKGACATSATAREARE